MKRLFIVLLITHLLALSPTALSGITFGGDSSSSKPIPLKNTITKNPTDRPRLPELQSVTCFNDDGLFIIEFAVPEGECYIYIETWEGGVFDYYFDSSELISAVYVGKCKEASIRITTEWGNEYYGLIPGE